MLIGPNSVVSFHYRLTNDGGQVLDASPDDTPLTYLHGAGNIVPGLERELTGKAVGAEFSVSVQPEDAYGARQPELVQEVPRTAFPAGQPVEEGMRFTAESPQGPISVEVTAVGADTVTIDANHPLAGEVLNFAITVAEVRAATDEEIAHGHVHGPDGHHH